MVLQVEVFNSVTGLSQLPVQAESAPATARITGAGTCQFKFKLDDLAERGIGKDKARELFAPRANFIAVHDGGSRVPYAGLILKRNPLDDAGGTLNVSTTEFRLATSWRMTAGVDNVRAGDLFATGRSASGALRRILQRMTLWSPDWRFPLDWESLVDGPGDIDVDAPWYSTLQIEDLIQDLEDRGYEVQFRPYRTEAGSLRIAPRIEKKIATGISDFSATAIKSKITGLEPVEDATRQYTGVLAAGTGSGSDTLFAYAGVGGVAGIPISDVRRDFSEITSQAALQQAAEAELERYKFPIEQWSYEIDLDDAGLGWEHVELGRRQMLDVRRHRWIPDGLYEKRVIATTTGLNGKVKVEVQ